MKAAIGSGVGKMAGAYIGSMPLAGVYHGDVKLWPDDLWQVSVLRFASDVRSVQMTHAMRRGSVSFEIGGVSYVHGVNMQIAADGMSVAFTGEDKPTKRAVVEALGEASNLSMILNANRVVAVPTSQTSSAYFQWTFDLPIAPFYARFSYTGLHHTNRRFRCTLYINSTEAQVDYKEQQMPTTSGDMRILFDRWSAFDSNMIFTMQAGVTVSEFKTRQAEVIFNEFSYTTQFNVTSIE